MYIRECKHKWYQIYKADYCLKHFKLVFEWEGVKNHGLTVWVIFNIIFIVFRIIVTFFSIEAMMFSNSPEILSFTTTLQGNYRFFTLHRVPETKLDNGTRGEVKHLISRKSCTKKCKNYSEDFSFLLSFLLYKYWFSTISLKICQNIYILHILNLSNQKGRICCFFFYGRFFHFLSHVMDMVNGHWWTISIA